MKEKKDSIPIIKRVKFKDNVYEPYADKKYIYLPIPIDCNVYYYAIPKKLLK